MRLSSGVTTYTSSTTRLSVRRSSHSPAIIRKPFSQLVQLGTSVEGVCPTNIAPLLDTQTLLQVPSKNLSPKGNVTFLKPSSTTKPSAVPPVESGLAGPSVIVYGSPTPALTDIGTSEIAPTL